MSVASPARMIGRGLVRRCPRCGTGRLFRHWFRMTEHCPRCGLRFEREEGSFLGAYVINYAAVAAVVAVVLAAVIVAEANNPDANLVPIIAVGGLGAVVTPIFCYPFSKTVWAAIELIMRPLDVAEEAVAAIAAGDPAAVSDTGQPDEPGDTDEPDQAGHLHRRATDIGDDDPPVP